MSAHVDQTATEAISEDTLTDTPNEVIELLNTLTTKIEDLEEELTRYKRFVGREIAEVRQKVNSSEESGEEASSEEKPQGKEVENGAPESPLTQLCSLPEHLAKENLTVNQQRARTVAKNVNSLSKKCPKGRVITSTDIRKAIAVDEGETPHTETVSRVIRFLQRFDDRISVVKRRGKRRVVFSEELTHSLERSHGGCDPSNIEGGRKPVILAG